MTRRGSTILEFVLAVGISSIIVLAIGKFSTTISGIGVVINNSLQIGQDLELSFRTITTDIRSMSPSSNGSYPIEAAASSSITFFSDIDQDGTFERVRYFLSTSTLEKGVVEPTGNPLLYVTSTEIQSSVIYNVRMGTSTLFQYYDENFNGSSTPLASPINIPDVRVVRMMLTADVSTSTAPKPATYSTIITIRNLRED